MVRKWLCGSGRVTDLQSGGCGFESRPGLLRTMSTQPSIPPGSVNEYQLQDKQVIIIIIFQYWQTALHFFFNYTAC